MSNQSVHITFKKGISRPSTAVIKRNDNSEIFISYKPNMVYHDLAHYAIEATLMKRMGFYWLINCGLTPADFELPKVRQPQQLVKALEETDNIAIEFFANQLMVEALNSGPIDNFMSVLKEGIAINDATQFSFPLSDSIVGEIRQLYKMIITDWHKMPEGVEKKVLVFYPDDDDRVDND